MANNSDRHDDGDGENGAEEFTKILRFVMAEPLDLAVGEMAKLLTARKPSPAELGSAIEGVAARAEHIIQDIGELRELRGRIDEESKLAADRAARLGRMLRRWSIALVVIGVAQAACLALAVVLLIGQ